VADFLNRESALLLVVDVQERLVPAIDKELYPRSLKNMQIMIEAAGTLGLPILLTEQYPKGLGATVPEVLTPLEGKPYRRFEKVTFSCARDEGFLQAVGAANRKQVMIVGMETHVCVFQTTRDLVAMGYEVHVCADAVSSRTEEHRRVGLELCREAGAIVTTAETAIFDLLHEAATPEFRKVAPLVK
jgi:nicotinamidase-related amidase